MTYLESITAINDIVLNEKNRTKAMCEIMDIVHDIARDNFNNGIDKGIELAKNT